MPAPYILTIYIAEGGTPLLDHRNGNPTGEKSRSGHMWYSIREENGPDATEQSYGFQPKVSGFSGAGEVTDKDIGTYYKPRYTRTIEITQEQYERLKEFGDNGVDENWDFFKDTNFRSQYNAATNSCVDLLGLLSSTQDLKGVR